MRPATGFDAWAARVELGDAGVELGPTEPLLQTTAFECYPS